MSIILWISLEKGECFDFNQSLGCVYPPLHIITLLGQGYHFSLLIYYPCSLISQVRFHFFTWKIYFCYAMQRKILSSSYTANLFWRGLLVFATEFMQAMRSMLPKNDKKINKKWKKKWTFLIKNEFANKKKDKKLCNTFQE